ncbi:hypothetical protein NYE69_14820 [Paenibacillus sp. FSL R5-0527]|uniref:hypothetical protein n=1 Tax=Paenibacillus sp. FSL R5-0527 TaxID=2975321 RepID=UPI00097A0B22|nr:hypothetical protein BK140_04420 [Paenibacillus macerans]
MSKILPLGESPIIGYQYHAYPLLISSLHPSFYEWFYSNYIQLECSPLVSPLTFDFYTFEKLNSKSPFLGEMYFLKSMINKYTSPMQFIIDALADEHYIVSFVDEFYIPNRQAYQRFHNVHDIMIYGFDLTQKIFYVAGYKEDRKFGFTEVDFDHFEKALLIGASEGSLGQWADGMHLMKLKLDTSFTLNLNVLVDLMEDYVHSRNTSMRFRMIQDSKKSIFGIDTFDYVLEYLRQYNGEKLDVRIFHTIYEHKKTMVSRIRYLRDVTGIEFTPALVNEFVELENNALIGRNLCLKYELSGVKQNVKRMAEIYKQIRTKERNLLEAAIHEIKAQLNPINIHN